MEAPMDLTQNVKSIVITYESEECVRLSGEEANKFRDVLRRMDTVYSTTVLVADGNELIDFYTHFNYEVIRKKASFEE